MYVTKLQAAAARASLLQARVHELLQHDVVVVPVRGAQVCLVPDAGEHLDELFFNSVGFRGA